MQIASWLLATSTLVVPPAGPAAGTPAAEASATVVMAEQQRPRQIGPAVTQTPSRRVGIGGGLAVSNYGISGSARYWFSRHVGVSMQAGWYRPRAYNTGYTTANQSSTITATPSLMVMFNQTDPDREVSLRPYVGAGVTYARATRPSQTPTTPGATYSGMTPQGFGGTEILFRDYENLALSAEATYYKLPVSFVNARQVNGLNFQVTAHFYLK
jgi:outer membrane protein W